MGGVGVELGKMGVLLIAKKVNLKRSHQKKKGSLPWWLHGKESSWNAGDDREAGVPGGWPLRIMSRDSIAFWLLIVSKKWAGERRVETWYLFP